MAPQSRLFEPPLYDPLVRSLEMYRQTCKGSKRRYYRFRPARFYGGIVTGDVCGCNLLCTFCWARDDVRERPGSVGSLHSPESAFAKLDSIGRKKGYRQLRLSGQEATVGREHLLALLELSSREGYRFILETNGILLGAGGDEMEGAVGRGGAEKATGPDKAAGPDKVTDLDDEERTVVSTWGKGYAEELSWFRGLHVRVCIKGCTPEHFSYLTGSTPKGFEYQMRALENLQAAGVSFHPALMAPGADRRMMARLEERLRAIDPGLPAELEAEEMTLYPHVKKRLARLGLPLELGLKDPDRDVSGDAGGKKGC